MIREPHGRTRSQEKPRKRAPTQRSEELSLFLIPARHLIFFYFILFGFFIPNLVDKRTQRGGARITREAFQASVFPRSGAEWFKPNAFIPTVGRDLDLSIRWDITARAARLAFIISFPAPGDSRRAPGAADMAGHMCGKMFFSRCSRYVFLRGGPQVQTALNYIYVFKTHSKTLAPPF